MGFTHYRSRHYRRAVVSSGFLALFCLGLAWHLLPPDMRIDLHLLFQHWSSTLKTASIIALTILVIICAVAMSWIVYNSRRIVLNASGYLFYPLLGFQHRFIAQRHLNRRLLPGEEVHHINGRRTDNRISNLCVMSKHDHQAFHHWLNQERQRLGRYPSIPEQKKILARDYGGIIVGWLAPPV